MRGLPRDRGHVLHRAGTGPDRRHPLPGRRLAVIPAGRMELPAAEPPRARDVRDVGHVEHPDGTDHHVELVLLTVLGAQRPAPSLIRPARRDDRGTGPQVGVQPVVGSHLLEVGQDLGLVRVGLAPPRVERKRIRVQMRRHIAGGAGEGVVPPCPAEPVGAVEDREVVPPGGELDSHRDATGARPDDRDVRFHPHCEKYGRSGRLFSTRMNTTPHGSTNQVVRTRATSATPLTRKRTPLLSSSARVASMSAQISPTCESPWSVRSPMAARTLPR